MKFSALVALFCTGYVSGALVAVRRADFALQNGKDAIALNQKFASLTPDSPCAVGDIACIQDAFAQCSNGKFVLEPCSGGSGVVCAALPLVNSAGTSITCTTPADRDARIAATGATADPSVSSSDASTPTPTAAPSGGGSSAGGSSGPDGSQDEDPQSSLTLLQSVIATGFENDGQDQPADGQVASLTSSNNFINFCATVPNLPITNGQQIKGGSCNPAPMGIIASANNIPSAKFKFPRNGQTIDANKGFTVKLAINHLEAGHFVNANENYYSAPQVVNDAGDIQGHSHIVIEQLGSLDQTDPLDPTKFAFFKGLNAAAEDGILSADVTDGLNPGFYRIASINSAANHQPVLVAVAQRGSCDDMVYFTVQ